MVNVHDVERKIPCKVLEYKIDGSSYQYAVEATASIDNCLIALDKIADHMRNLKKEAEAQQPIQE